jgi:hypothetical protein
VMKACVNVHRRRKQNPWNPRMTSSSWEDSQEDRGHYLEWASTSFLQ